jgi:hypothetical protein
VVASCLLAVVVSTRARAESTSALNKIVDLNKKAMQAFDQLDMETAAKLLKQAIELCNLEGPERHAVAARSHLHLGVVYVRGLKLRNRGLTEFRRAIAIEPNIKISKSLVTPDVEAVFADAAAAGGAPAAAVASRPSTGQGAAAPMVAGPSSITHPPITEAFIGKPIEIKAQIPATLHAEKIVLAYRSGSEGEFLAREMRAIDSAPGWYHEKIPAEATLGSNVTYYIEAQDADGQPLASSGGQDAPHDIKLGSEQSNAAELTDLTQQGVAQGQVSAPGASATKAASGSPLWFVLAAGVGGGYFSGTPEMNPVGDDGRALASSGSDLAKLGHLAPEVGYFYSDHWLLSLQGRFQYLSGGQDVTYAGKTYKPTNFALAGVVKASYFLVDPSEHFQPFVTAQAGVGDIRYPVRTPPLQGCGQNGAIAGCSDTVRSGLALAGVAAGVVYMLGESIGIYASLSTLAGLPDFALNADLNLGIAFIR